MARKPGPQPLTLGETHSVNEEQQFLDSPKTPLSPTSPKTPRSPFIFTTKKSQSEQSMQGPEVREKQQTRAEIPQSQTVPALYQYSAGSSEEGRQERGRPARSGFFSNYKASKSSSRLQPSDSARGIEESMSRGTDRPTIPGRVSSQESGRNDPEVDKSTTRKPISGPSKSQSIHAIVTPHEPSPSSNTLTKKNKPKPFSLLGRSKSIRGDEQSPRDSSPNNKHLAPAHAHNDSVKTAPLQSERTFKDMMSSNVRNHSADRQQTTSRDIVGAKDKENRTQSNLSSSYREGGGHGFLNNLKSSASKGAGALSKGLFGKSGRSGSTTEKEGPVDDEHYQLKVINKPLVEQTRLTRISKRLEDSRDKTEFWMPAFPWRAIDYLNYKGSDVEGLYRVPGSGPQIKRWQRRFDEEKDIDLFEQDDLYDINIIGSMLKAWLRELPDELFPKAAQDRIARQCSGAETVPQLLVDELSNLSPFNYYLLFAITCHLSLLLAHSEKNKMDFRNLCICFQPCMKIDMFCFKFLVCDWRDCWKGCKTEAEYIDAEYQIFAQQEIPPNSAEGRSSTAVESHDERNISSSDSSKPSSVSVNDLQKWGQSQGQQDRNSKLPLSQSQASMNTVSTTLTVVEERTPQRKSADMRPLSPIKPLSPIGL